MRHELEAQKLDLVEQKDEAQQQRTTAERNLYLADMSLAQHDWASGQISRLHKMLDAHMPEPGGSDFRGWEWYYYLSKCHGEVRNFRGHQSKVHSVVWCPDGRRLASASSDTTVRIWDVDTGKEISTLKGDDYEIFDLSWSPDGSRLAI
ncbi:MAG: WD40 repeat domain-containing protein [Pirellulales bacterium]